MPKLVSFFYKVQPPHTDVNPQFPDPEKLPGSTLLPETLNGCNVISPVAEFMDQVPSTTIELLMSLQPPVMRPAVGRNLFGIVPVNVIGTELPAVADTDGIRNVTHDPTRHTEYDKVCGDENAPVAVPEIDILS